MYKNKADLQFAIMQAGDQAAAQVHPTRAGHLARAAALWHLADAAATAGLSVRLPSMRWVRGVALFILADTDEEEAAAQRVIEEWAADEAGYISFMSRDGCTAAYSVHFENQMPITVNLTREQWQ